MKLFRKWQWLPSIPATELEQCMNSPLADEARGFARLCDVGQNGTWAVRCHGWMKLTDEQFHVLKVKSARGPLLEWECTLWAIIKDYEAQPVRPEHVPRILERIEIAKDALLIPGDVAARNFRNGLLVDLGGTKTFPLGRRFWSAKVYNRFYEDFRYTIRDWMFLEDGTVGSWHFDRHRLAT